MSRVGNKPVVYPAEVTVGLNGQVLNVKGPHGDLTLSVHPGVSVSVDAEQKKITVSRPDDQRESRALHGLTRSLINNMVTGVVKPFEKSLIIVGVGYNAALSGNKLALRVGYANTIELEVPAGVICECQSNVKVVVRGADRQVVGQFAADIRGVRPPEPYKGKGIRYEDEFVRRKSGKAFGSK